MRGTKRTKLALLAVASALLITGVTLSAYLSQAVTTPIIVTGAEIVLDEFELDYVNEARNGNFLPEETAILKNKEFEKGIKNSGNIPTIVELNLENIVAMVKMDEATFDALEPEVQADYIKTDDIDAQGNKIIIMSEKRKNEVVKVSMDTVEDTTKVVWVDNILTSDPNAVAIDSLSRYYVRIEPKQTLQLNEIKLEVLAELGNPANTANGLVDRPWEQATSFKASARIQGTQAGKFAVEAYFGQPAVDKIDIHTEGYPELIEKWWGPNADFVSEEKPEAKDERIYFIDAIVGVIIEPDPAHAGKVQITYDHGQGQTTDIDIDPVNTMFRLKLNTGQVTSGITVDNCEVNVKLDNVYIGRVDANRSAFDIKNSGTVNLTLVGNSALSSHSTKAAIEVNEGSTLIVTAASDGTLKAGKVKTTGAGIGGSAEESAGNIIIKGGTIEAVSGSGAGIGSGASKNQGSMDTGFITIEGGQVSAISKTGAAIGSGALRDTAPITIKGGTISAVSENGAGIGGGEFATTTNLSIEGGTIIASSSSGAGIGSGGMGSGAIINIKDTNITATSITGASIGGGFTGNSGFINISDSQLNLKSSAGANVGGGEHGAGINMVVTGCEIKAETMAGAVVGGGRNQPSSDITVKNTNITTNPNTKIFGAGLIEDEDEETLANGKIVAENVKVNGVDYK